MLELVKMKPVSGQLTTFYAKDLSSKVMIGFHLVERRTQLILRFLETCKTVWRLMHSEFKR